MWDCECNQCAWVHNFNQTTLKQAFFHAVHKSTWLRIQLGRLVGIRINRLVLCEEWKRGLNRQSQMNACPVYIWRAFTVKKWAKTSKFYRKGVWGAVRKNIISDRFSTKQLSLCKFSYLCAEIAISFQRGSKVVKFHFTHSKLKNQPFLLKI